ncbi:hypothetical protein [Stappia stellulata]|uniref:hypothetical protein n=1 Tax=Stappia stellulata TaxID=71235 RepID=UPI00048AF0D5|nr:hypothetical protein [Stappia stellulata]
MTILLAEADAARCALPLAGALTEALKVIKIARNLPMPDQAVRRLFATNRFDHKCQQYIWFASKSACRRTFLG